MASNPFITSAGGMQVPLASDLAPDASAIERQRRFAQLLMQQSQAPQGQNVSGIYVAPSLTQNLQSLVNPLVGAYMEKGAEEKSKDLAQRLRRMGMEESKQILQAMRGTPEQVSYSAEDVGPSRTVTPAVAGDMEQAYMLASGAQTPQGMALAPVLAKQLMREPKWEMKGIYNEQTGNTDLYQYNANAPDPSKTMQKVGTEKPALSAKDIIDFRDRGINVGGGMPSGGVSMGGGMPMGGGQGGGQVTGDAKYMPSNLPTYQYDPSLSPAQNRELAGKFAEDLRKNVKNARDAFGTIQSVAEILSSGKPSSGRGENIITGTREFFGGGGEQSKTDAQLRVLGQKLVQQVPRFEGPQSDKDVASYQAAAGDIGNPNMPIETRMAALQTLVDLNKKYYPNGDWDKIDLAGPVKTKQTFFKGSKTMSPTEFRKGLTGQDQEAFDWARRNPNDPRATEIRNRLGF